MPTYVEIAVNIPKVSGEFHYHLPSNLVGRVKPGHLVVVPFGKQLVQGVVLAEVEKPDVSETRAVKKLLDDEIALTTAQIKLAYHMAEQTLYPLASCIALMLPSGLAQQADTLFSLVVGSDVREITDIQKRLVRLLEERGPLRGRQIDRVFSRLRWRNSAAGLVRRGVLENEPVLPSPSVGVRRVHTVQLIADPEKVEAARATIGRTGTRALERRQKILDFLTRERGPINVSWVYAESGGNLADLRLLADKELVSLSEAEILRDPLASLEPVQVAPPSLTSDQEKVWKVIRAGLTCSFFGEEVQPFLLHGVTGSGKTEIYLRAVAETIKKGRQAIVLVPEIALTPQTTRRFIERFPEKVGLIHSQLSLGERYDTWRRARAGELPIIVGPRSALFTPLPTLGLIVIDECHDSSYYQSEPPFYHARDIAIQYARIIQGVCIMGSATPEVTTSYQAREEKWQLVKLPQRILAHKEAVEAHLTRLGKGKRIPTHYQPEGEMVLASELPPIRIVDMRQELKAGNLSIFSRRLQDALSNTLSQGQQAILFLNRRGTATYVFCRDCGTALRCPRCEEAALTYHKGRQKLLCHHCGYTRNLPKTCPQCGSTRIRHYGTGTEKVEAEVKAQFPEAITLRWDWDTTRRKGAHDIILDHFANHRANVLVGTQMLAKGLDLPLVTLVGVVLADVGLHLPDFRAGERSFQVLSQVAGRAGRSPLGGQVILQTFNPEHYVIRTAANHDYETFYQQELLFRKEMSYPPFNKLVRLEYRHREAHHAETAAKNMAVQIRDWIRSEGKRQTSLIGPVPCFYARLDGWYRWQILLRGPDPAAVLKGHNLSEWRVETNPFTLL